MWGDYGCLNMVHEVCRCLYGSDVFVNVSSCTHDSISLSALCDGIELWGCVCEFLPLFVVVPLVCSAGAVDVCVLGGVWFIVGAPGRTCFVFCRFERF